MKIAFKLSVVLHFISKICCFNYENFFQLDPETFFNVTELIIARGYPVENYIVQTIDGYLLSMQRIPYGKKAPTRTGRKKAILLIHGGVGDSIIWVWNFENQSLAYVLADNDYDVWMGNFRGNTYSRRNVRLSPSQNEFWDFSLDEKAQIDLPAMIDFVLNKTGHDTISYLGYSEGSTVIAALLCYSPYYNQKINLFASYGHVVYVRHLKSILLVGIVLGSFLRPFYKQIGLVYIFPHTTFTDLITKYVCATPLQFICKIIFYSIFGFDPTQLNNTRFTLFFNQYLAAESTKVLIHYSQIFYSQKFRMYNYYGLNQQYYNQPSPPEYDLSKITVPVALYNGLNDINAAQADIQKFISEVNTVVENFIPDYPIFNHADYIVGVDAYELVHKQFLSTLDRYSRD